MLPENEKMTKIFVGRCHGKTTQTIYTPKSAKFDSTFVGIKIYPKEIPDQITLFEIKKADDIIRQQFNFDEPSLFLKFNYNDTMIEDCPVIENIDAYYIATRNFFTHEYSLEFIATITENDICSFDKNKHIKYPRDLEAAKDFAVMAAYKILNY